MRIDVVEEGGEQARRQGCRGDAENNAGERGSEAVNSARSEGDAPRAMRMPISWVLVAIA